MGKLCMECLDSYKNDSITTPFYVSPQGSYQKCPKRHCSGKIFNIDDTILETIIILNAKGFTTVSSCGGHSFDEAPEIYIEFDESVTLNDFNVLPMGFRLKSKKTAEGDRLIMSHSIDSEDVVEDIGEIFSYILSISEELHSWAVYDLEGKDIFGLFELDSLDIIDNLNQLFSKKQEPKQSLEEVAPEGKIKLGIKKEVQPETTKEAVPAEEIKKPRARKKRTEKEDK